MPDTTLQIQKTFSLRNEKKFQIRHAYAPDRHIGSPYLAYQLSDSTRQEFYRVNTSIIPRATIHVASSREAIMGVAVSRHDSVIDATIRLCLLNSDNLSSISSHFSASIPKSSRLVQISLQPEIIKIVMVFNYSFIIS